ncbi:hypothetical protein BDFB_011139 [Asbolus verrucosus]|uniref:Uncharacterized protein n=1 Tax=Asbolus verrucosus TaxID=1661398 RepID=A0A482VWT1_ASBVE|nr:hypothetical protein BDFB_011139 [Asbolus verrucosus]
MDHNNNILVKTSAIQTQFPRDSHDPIPPEEQFKASDLTAEEIQTNRVERNNATDSNSPSFDDLLESFGGTDERNNIKEAENANGKTGIYFLVDWNTFFDIDDQLGRRVNLRLQPKIGDPKRFLSVTVA